MEIRVRFAPSPTGILHVGNARTALFNWLFARHRDGCYVLRIEDTDQARSKPEFTLDILDGLRWLGLDWDEGPEAGGDFGPYAQSERFDLYRELAEGLVERGLAYRCFCTEEELEAERTKALEISQAPRYRGQCSALSPEEEAAYIKEGRRPSIRFRVPDKKVYFTDLIKGEMCFNVGHMGDFVIMKSDGTPSYNFAAAVDDSGMQITHIIRGEDHLSNTPRQIVLYEALGKPIPQFAHLPMILGTDHTKLSKRHGATAITQYRERGYLPEAMVNYLALLGWAPPVGKEQLTLKEMVEAFDVGRIAHSPAVFDLDKLNWLNRQYLRKLSQDDYLKRARTFCQAPDEALLLVWDSIQVFSDIPVQLAFYWELPAYPPEDVQGLLEQPTAQEVLALVVQHLKTTDELTGVGGWLKALAKEKGIPLKQVLMPVRFALTAATHGPEIAKVIQLLGRKRSVERLQRFLPTSGTQVFEPNRE